MHASSEGVTPLDPEYAIFRMNEVFAGLEDRIPATTQALTDPHFQPPVVLVGDSGEVRHTYQEWIREAETQLLNKLPAEETEPGQADAPRPPRNPLNYIPQLVALKSKEVDLLLQQLIALRYRTGQFTESQTQINQQARALYVMDNGMVVPDQVMPEADAEEQQAQDKVDNRYNQLAPIIKRYKASTSIYPREKTTPAPELTQRDVQQLRKLCMRYPLFADLLIARNQGENAGKDALSADCIKFCFRSGCSVGVFVKAPNTRVEISYAHLDKRTGAVDSHRGIKFAKQTQDAHSPRVVCMKMNREFVPIQGSQNKQRVVHLPNLADPTKDDYTPTVADILKQFKEKTTLYGNVEYIWDHGVANFDAIKLGSYDPVSKKVIPLAVSVEGTPRAQRIKLLETLPALTVITEEELEQRYAGQRIPGRNEFGFAVKATRTRPNRDIADNHALVELVVRQTNGTYKIYDIGMQPLVMPQCTLDKALSLGDTQEAGIHIVDESGYLSQRETHAVMHIFKEDKFNDLVLKIRDKIVAGRNGNLVFQPTGENCAHFVMSLVYEFITIHLKRPLDTVARAIMNRDAGWDQNEVGDLIEQALFYFNDGALEKLLDTILTSTLGNTSLTTANIGHLMMLVGGAIDLLSVTVMKDEETWNPKVKKEELKRLLEEFQNAEKITPEERQAFASELKGWLKQLVTLAVRGQQYYKTGMFEAEYNNFIGYLITGMGMIPWIWLRNAVWEVFTFLFLWSFRWRNVTYQKVVGEKTVDVAGSKSVRTSGYWTQDELIFNLPASLFEYNKKAPVMRSEVTELTSKFALRHFPQSHVRAPSEGSAEAAGLGLERKESGPALPPGSPLVTATA
ncbi:MAG: hypothetical protein HYX48_05845 [Chlamydiales bacterium]|nr:hypothetical protein [Chlamydiales bacterium]